MEFWCRKCFGSKGCLGNFDQEPWSVTSSFTWSRMEWCILSVLLGYFHPLGCFRKFDQFEILTGPAWCIQTFPRMYLVLTHFDLILSNFCCQNWHYSHYQNVWNFNWGLCFKPMIFQKQNCPGDSQKKAFPVFQGSFSQISIKVDVSFLRMIIPIIVCNFEHIWYLSLSSQNIFHVCTYFAQNIHMSNQTPELCTTIRYGRQKI